MIRGLSSFIYFKILGWKLIGDFSDQTIKKCVIIVVPHTSWHDFYIGLLIRKIAGVKISFMNISALLNQFVLHESSAGTVRVHF